MAKKKTWLKKLGWSAVAGILFGFIVGIFTNFDSISAGLGLLVAYMEYRLQK